MKVNVLGFTWTTGKGISMEDFFKYLKNDCGKEIKHSGCPRIYHLAEQGDYYTGIYLTIKNEKSYTKIKRSKGSLTIDVETIGKDEHLMEFNYFILHKKTGVGLYQHYHNSSGLISFTNFFNKKYLKLRKKRIKDSKILTGKSNEKLEEQFKGALTLQQLVRKENLEALLLEFDAIKSFDCNLVYLFANEPTFSPVKECLKNVRHHVTFKVSDKENPAHLIKKSILSLVKQQNIKEGKIVGNDESGLERIIHLINTPDVFGEMNYENILQQDIGLDVANFQNSVVLKQLFGYAKSHKKILETANNLVK